MTTDDLQIRITIERHGDGYRGTRQLGEGKRRTRLKNMRLEPDATVIIRDQPHALSELLEDLLRHGSQNLPAEFDERTQHDVGRHLSEQLFSDLSDNQQKMLNKARGVDLTIVSRDPHIARLPWTLLVWQNAFVATGNWSIALATDTVRLDETCEFPRSPKMVIGAPNPPFSSLPDTETNQHIDELESALQAYSPNLKRGRRLIVADTWTSLCQALDEHQPEVLYYYGHGHGDADRARLMFPDCPDGLPIADLAVKLRNLDRPPLIVYLNCCFGDAGGELGAGGQLADLVRVLVSNRAGVLVPHARRQAVRFFTQTLLFGIEPQDAMRELYAQGEKAGFTVAEPCWMIPVLYRGFGKWECHGVTGKTWVTDPDWREKLDREFQWPIVFDRTHNMLQDGKPKGLAFFWYGRKGDGQDHFHQRLKVELRRRTGEDVRVLEYLPNWPDDLSTMDDTFPVETSFTEMYKRVFDTGHLEDIAIKVRRKASSDCRKTLVYIRHLVLTRRQALNTAFLKRYLLWWDLWLPKMLGGGQYGLLGISYEAKPDEDPEEFKRIVKDQLKLERLKYEHVRCKVLPRFSDVDEAHLEDFMERFGFPLPPEGGESIVEGICERSGRLYEPMIRELEAWLRSRYGMDP